MYPLSMCVVLTHNRCGVLIMRTQPLEELILTAILLGLFLPCPRLTQPPWMAVEPWFLPSFGHLLHFTNHSGFSIFRDCGEWTGDEFSKNHCQESACSFLHDESDSSLFQKRFPSGGGGCFPEGKGSYPLGKDAVLQQYISERDTVTYVFLTRYSWSRHLERQQLEILTSSFYQECWSRPVTHAAVARFTAKRLSDVGGCCPFKDFGISAFS